MENQNSDLSQLYDTDASLYVLSCLMRKPLLLQNEKYIFTETDFEKALHQIIFAAIYNIAQQGVEKIVPQDIDLYLHQYDAQYAYYKANKGYEVLLQCYQLTEESDDKQFDFYYDRCKKFSLLRDLKRSGYNVDQFYNVNAVFDKDKEDEKLNRTNIKDILNTIRGNLATIENRHIGKEDGTSQEAAVGMRALVAQLLERPEVGLPLDGDIINWATRGARLGKLYIYSGSSGSGKALPNSTLIPMYDGSWKTVGEVEEGDLLIDRNGKATKVLKIFPQGLKDVYKITFKDGRTALCNDEHLWTIHSSTSKDNNSLVTLTLREIIDKIEKLGYQSCNQYRFSIPLNNSIQYQKRELKLNPYILGLFLGDGSFREVKSNRNLTFSTSDEELVDYISKTQNWSYKRNSVYNYTYYFKDNNGNNIHVTEFLTECGLENLINTKSETKFIPDDYLYSSINDRFELLNGLLDTDGSVDSKGRINFTTINTRLKNQVVQLCRSLGFIPTVVIDKRSEKYVTGVCYDIRITGTPELKNKCFKLSRKKKIINDWFNNGKRKEKNIYNPIVKIEKLDYQEEMTCFLVDNEEHLFLMNDYIVTHNTRYMVGNACAISMPYIDKNGKIVIRGAEDGSDYQKVLFVATEMSADEIQTLILAYVSGVNESHILLGNYTQEEKERVDLALDIIDKYGKNFIIECIPDPTIAMIKARLIKYIVQDGVEYIFYDYIFTSPGLITEFATADVKEYVALMMLSNSLKEIAMSYNVFIQSATQLNENWSKIETGLRDQNCLRGSKAIADKIDIGVIGIRLRNEEAEKIKESWERLKALDPIKFNIEPNIVMDIYKNRRGEMNSVKIFRYFDYGTCHCKDYFVTDGNYNAIENVHSIQYETHKIDGDEWKEKELGGEQVND